MEFNKSPIWMLRNNENAQVDLFMKIDAQEIYHRLTKAVDSPGSPVELKDALLLINKIAILFDSMLESTKQAPKPRKEIVQLVTDLKEILEMLKEQRGFDLFDESTWTH
jgi:hypothetical protein